MLELWGIQISHRQPLSDLVTHWPKTLKIHHARLREVKFIRLFEVKSQGFWTYVPNIPAIKIRIFFTGDIARTRIMRADRPIMNFIKYTRNISNEILQTYFGRNFYLPRCLMRTIDMHIVKYNKERPFILKVIMKNAWLECWAWKVPKGCAVLFWLFKSRKMLMRDEIYCLHH